MFKGKVRATMLAAVMAGFTVLAACDDKINDDTYTQIKVGMSQDEIENLMGGSGTRLEVGGTSISGAGVAGGAASNSQTTYEWKKGHKIISVTFANKKVVSMSKSW